MRSSSETIVRCAARLNAATTSPPRGEDRDGDGSEPVRELLVVDRDARLANAPEVGEQRGLRRARVGAAPGERGAVEDVVALGLGEEREQHLAQGGAVRREPGADMEVEVDLVLVPARGAEALDVDDVDVVEDRQVDGMPRLVAEPLEVRRGHVPELHRVDRREPEVEHARAERVLAGCGVLVEVAELREGGDVAVRGAPREAELLRDLADADQLPAGGERGEDRETALERLRRAGPRSARPLHPARST